MNHLLMAVCCLCALVFAGAIGLSYTYVEIGQGLHPALACVVAGFAALAGTWASGQIDDGAPS